MKKPYFILMMMATMVTSCNKEDVITVASQAPISFGKIFVDKSTRAGDPSYTTDNLKIFNVYGNMTGMAHTVNIYQGDAVTKQDDGTWSCGVTQYWVPECSYDFAAIAGYHYTDAVTGAKATDNFVVVTDEDGLPKSIKYSVACQRDLLYATVSDETNNLGVPKETGQTEGGVINPVPFNFEHLLSKVQFIFTNGFSTESGVELTVTDIKITNATAEATYTIDRTTPAKSAWGSHSTTTVGSEGVDPEGQELNFGSTSAFAAGLTGASSNHCLLIPHIQSFVISFTVKHNKGGSDTPLKITTPAIPLEKGNHYNFTAELNASNVEGVVPITFNITADGDWSGEDKPVGPDYEP